MRVSRDLNPAIQKDSSTHILALELVHGIIRYGSCITVNTFGVTHRWVLGRVHCTCVNLTIPECLRWVSVKNNPKRAESSHKFLLHHPAMHNTAIVKLCDRSVSGLWMWGRIFAGLSGWLTLAPEFILGELFSQNGNCGERNCAQGRDNTHFGVQ